MGVGGRGWSVGGAWVERGWSVGGFRWAFVGRYLCRRVVLQVATPTDLLYIGGLIAKHRIGLVNYAHREVARV